MSHREFADHTAAFALLSEKASAAMGRFRGRTDTALILDGVDRNDEIAHTLGRLFVPFTAGGHPLRARVARNMATIEEPSPLTMRPIPERRSCWRTCPATKP